MEIIVYITIVLLYIAFVIAIWASIFNKAGYSGWLGLLMFIPIANLVMLIYFVWRQWPIQREVRDLRIRCGSGNEEDAYSLMNDAIHLEARGNLEDALIKYQEVVTRFRDTSACKDTEKSVKALRNLLANC